MSGFGRIRQLLATTGTEVFGVAVGAVAGFLIVNWLPKEAYAEYTFLIACLTLITGLSDMGLSHCYLPIVGERNKDVRWVLGACRRVYQKRWQLMTLAALFIVPYWFFTSMQHGWMNSHHILAFASVTITALLTVREQLGKTLLIIFEKISIINRAGLFANLTRLALVTVALWWVPSDFVVACLIVASAIASLLVLAQYRRVPVLSGFSGAKLDFAEKIHVDQKIKGIMKPLILPSLFYQFQGVITIFLISLFGTPSAIAEIGALSRLAMILTIVDRVAAMLVFSKIARTSAGVLLQRLIVKVHVIYLFLMVALLSSAIFLPHIWILLLGAQYKSQEHLVWMAFLPAILMNGSGFAFTTLSARGMTARQWTAIPLVIAAQIIFIYFIGVGNTFNALLFSIMTGSIYFSSQYLILFFNFNNLIKIEGSE